MKTHANNVLIYKSNGLYNVVMFKMFLFHHLIFLNFFYLITQYYLQNIAYIQYIYNDKCLKYYLTIFSFNINIHCIF